MEEEIEEKLIAKQLIAEQDRNIYFGCNLYIKGIIDGMSGGIELKTGKSYRDLIKEFYIRKEIIPEISIQNLLIMFVSLNDKQEYTSVEEIIMERVKNGEDPFLQPNFEIDSFGLITSLYSKSLQRFSRSNREIIRNIMKNNIKKFENNEEISKNFMKNYPNIENYNYFINLYNNNMITEKAFQRIKK